MKVLDDATIKALFCQKSTHHLLGFLRLYITCFKVHVYITCFGYITCCGREEKSFIYGPGLVIWDQNALTYLEETTVYSRDFQLTLRIII